MKFQHLRTAPVVLAAVLAAPLQAAELTTEQKLERLADEVEQLRQQVDGAESAPGKTTVGGYGELHYNRWKNKLDRSEKNELDFHRFVLYFGHAFSDTVRLVSELELEHALVEDTDDGSGPGEIELEQAYVEVDVTRSLSARGGLFLVPVGILNETHEPPTFYGVERNPVENKIIPTTWWEGGLGVTARAPGALAVDVAVHSGLFTGAPDYNIREGREEVAKAAANDWAATTRLKWTGVRGLELALTGQYQQDITQGAEAEAVPAALLESHLIFERGPVGLRALYANWTLDGDGPEAAGADRQFGWYVEPSIKLTRQLGVFARYNFWDNQAGDSTDSEYKQVDVGLSYWPHENVVIKIDYQDQDVPDGESEYDGYNVGLGYMF